MRFFLHYRGLRRSIQIDASCLVPARARYAAIQNEPAYIDALWTPQQWDAIASAFEMDFSSANYASGQGRFLLDRRLVSGRLRYFVPLGFCLTATLFLELCLLQEPNLSVSGLKTYLDAAPFFGDVRYPAVRYLGRVFVLPAALVTPAASALFRLLEDCEELQQNQVPLSFFKVLWAALQAQLSAAPPADLFSLCFERRRASVPAPRALIATLALVPLLFSQDAVDPSTAWNQFRSSWDPACTPLTAFDPAAHSAATAPAALAPEPFLADVVLPLAPAVTSAWLCRFCSASFDTAELFSLHLAATHDLSLSSYASALHAACSHAFPRPADPLHVRHVLATYRDCAVLTWSTPLPPCAVCAMVPPDHRCIDVDLRDPTRSVDFVRLHDFFSARAYVARYHARLPSGLPATFLGLRFQDLLPYSVSVPAFDATATALQPEDRWVLHLAEPRRQAWETAANDPAQPLRLPMCASCKQALLPPRLQLPARALANDNLHVPWPASLQDLTPAEILFVSRAFTHCKLISLPARGPAEIRQSALVGNVVSFPQNAAPLLSALPRPAASVAEMLIVFFPSDARVSMAARREFVVRRVRVAEAIGWLQTHSPAYADVLLDPANLAALPEEGVPDALLVAAQSLPHDLSPDAGPAEAASAEPPLRALSAAVLDCEGEATHPLARWQQALLATSDAVDTLSGSEPDPVCVSSHIARAATALQALSVDDGSQEVLTAEAALVPHGSTPLSAFHPAYWTLCFPHLFPFGEPTEHVPRRVRLLDSFWVRSLVLRADRSSFSWRLDHSFLAVAFNVLHRRALMRAVRAKIRSPGFSATLNDVRALRAIDFRRVLDVVGEHGGVPQALRHHGVTAAMKNILGMLRIVSGSVPCTDAARTNMRHELTALQLFFGFPTLFVTFNPCDTRHPFTCFFHLPQTHGSTQALPELDDALFQCLRQVNLAQIVASDPAAAAAAFHLHVTLFLRVLLGADFAVTQSAFTTEGLLGDVLAFYGVTEPQNRGSLHLHLLVHLAGFTSPQALIARFAGRLPALLAALRAWAASLQHTSLEAVPATLQSPAAATRLPQLQPLPFTRSHRSALGPSFASFLTRAETHWYPADPTRMVVAAPLSEGAWYDPFGDAAADRAACLPWARSYLHSARLEFCPVVRCPAYRGPVRLARMPGRIVP